MRLVLLAFALLAGDARPELQFVACPVYRDTDAGRKSGCWLADNPVDGTRYDITGAPTKPDWNHAILVEGRSAGLTESPCGGVILDPVRVSVIDAPCTRHLLPAEGYSGRKFALPKRNVRPLYEQRAKPSTPYEPRTIIIPFDQGSSFITYQLADYYLDAAINFALDVQPAQVTITGFAAAPRRVATGEDLSEQQSLAGERARKVARAFELRGVRVTRVSTGKASVSSGEAFDGLVSPSSRRVEVRITPRKTAAPAQP